MQWYRTLRRVTEDDRLDLDVMLLDHRHPEDALAAITGMITNLLENGWQEELMCMLARAAMPGQMDAPRIKAMIALLLFCYMYDQPTRLSHKLHEALLDMLEQPQQRETALTVLRNMNNVKQAVMFVGGKKLPLHQTFIYHLVAVGIENQIE